MKSGKLKLLIAESRLSGRLTVLPLPIALDHHKPKQSREQTTCLPAAFL
jgi:hypothetical protein